MTGWNTDMSAAPRTEQKAVERTIKGKTRSVRMDVPVKIWAASKCGKVTQSYWIPPTKFSAGRWDMFSQHGAPIAWRPFDADEFPYVIEGEGKEARRVYPNGDRPAHPSLELEF